MEIGLDLIDSKEPFYFGGHGNSGVLAEISPCRCAWWIEVMIPSLGGGWHLEKAKILKACGNGTQRQLEDKVNNTNTQPFTVSIVLSVILSYLVHTNKSLEILVPFYS